MYKNNNGLITDTKVSKHKDLLCLNEISSFKLALFLRDNVASNVKNE
ncbi:protein of unknown function [Tenacibaculum sp. 190524A05c]